MKLKKRHIFFAIFVIVLISFSAIACVLVYRGIPLREEVSPDGRFVVRSYQIFDSWDSIKYVRDKDSAHGYVRLFDSSGRQLDQTSCRYLTFLIVVWKDQEVEIQGDETLLWKLPKNAPPDLK